MPRKFLGGRKDVEKSASALIEVEVDTMCDQCFAPATKVYYNTKSKKLLVVCADDHECTIDGNWEWLVNGGR